MQKYVGINSTKTRAGDAVYIKNMCCSLDFAFGSFGKDFLPQHISIVTIFCWLGVESLKRRADPLFLLAPGPLFFYRLGVQSTALYFL